MGSRDEDARTCVRACAFVVYMGWIKSRCGEFVELCSEAGIECELPLGDSLLHTHTHTHRAGERERTREGRRREGGMSVPRFWIRNVSLSLKRGSEREGVAKCAHISPAS